MRLCLACGKRFGEPGWTCPGCGWAPVRDTFPLFAPDLAADEGFEPEAFAILEQIEDESFWFRARSGLIGDLVRKHFARAESFFEIGCGTGVVLAALRSIFPDLELTGGDASPTALEIAQRRLRRVELVQMDARRIPFADEFDVIGCFDVLEHIEDDEVVLAESRKAVRPDGGVIVSVPQHPRLWAAADEYARHRRRYTRRELARKLRRSGFEVHLLTSFVLLLLPAMALSRLRRKRLDERYDPRAEFPSGKTVNRALEGVLSAERALIRRGVSLPAGGSLFAVARRA